MTLFTYKNTGITHVTLIGTVFLCALIAGCLAPNQEEEACKIATTDLSLHDINAPSANAQWPSWGGDLNNSHHAASESRITPANVNQLEIKWAFQTTGSVSANPTIAGNTLYFPDWGPGLGGDINPDYQGGRLYAVNRWSGTETWSMPIRQYNDNDFNNISRSSPAISGDLIVIGDVQSAVPIGADSRLINPRHRILRQFDKPCGGYVYAVHRHTGKLVWKTLLGEQDFDQITQSPIIHNGKVYVGVSTQESAYAKNENVPCCKFRGSMVALDLHSGEELWRHYMTIENDGEYNQFSGASVWGGAPTIDPKRNSVYIPTGNNFHVPSSYAQCIKAATSDQQKNECKAVWQDNYFDSIVALDLDTGAKKWAMRSIPYDAWVAACEWEILTPLAGGSSFNCPDPIGPDADFAQPPMLYSIELNGDTVDRLAAGTKAGAFYSLDPNDGSVVWQRQLGLGGSLGGMLFGAATDGERIYFQNANFNHTPYVLEAGLHKDTEINGGFWGALDAKTGEILWQTPVPGVNLPLTQTPNIHLVWGFNKGPGWYKWPVGPLTVANGVVFAGVSDLEGTMVAMDATTGEILWQFNSGQSVASAPSVVDGRLYWGVGYKFGNSGNRLYSFGLPDDNR